MGDPGEILGLRLDADEYRPAPPTRWRQPYPGLAVTIMTAIGALLVGFLITTGVVTGRSAAQDQSARNAELVELITTRQQHVDAQAEQLEELRARVFTAQEELTGPTALRTAVVRAEQASGMSRVAGPGIRVTFDDASSGCPGVQQQDCRIQDTDLQLAVNTLFGLGAEAVAVNGERIIATTAIRSAGRAILVNYRVLSPPYVVEAIGNPQALVRDFPTSSLATDFEIWKGRYGLGFAYEAAERLELPAYSGSLRFTGAAVEEQT
jgi:uncharacterized protein YlxW (UPF0749 family)